MRIWAKGPTCLYKPVGLMRLCKIVYTFKYAFSVNVFFKVQEFSHLKCFKENSTQNSIYK